MRAIGLRAALKTDSPYVLLFSQAKFATVELFGKVAISRRGHMLIAYELKSVRREVCWPEEFEESMGMCLPAGPIPCLHRPYH